MKTRFGAIFAAACLVALLAAAVAGAAMVGIYRNGMETTAQRSQLIKLAGASCARGGSDGALRIAIGKATDACSYRTPVLGRDLEISATERLLSGTPEALQRRPTWAWSCGPGPAPSTSCSPSRCSARCSWSRSPKKAPSTWRSPRTSKS